MYKTIFCLSFGLAGLCLADTNSALETAKKELETLRFKELNEKTQSGEVFRNNTSAPFVQDVKDAEHYEKLIELKKKEIQQLEFELRKEQSLKIGQIYL